MSPLSGKHVLIIGGSSGIGFGVAQAALGEGARVTLASSSESKLRAAKARLGGGDAVGTEVLDVTQESQVKNLFVRLGTVNHLVYTAGEAFVSNDYSAMSIGEIKALMDVRYFGVILCARHGKGHISESFTTTSGSYAVRPVRGFSDVVASSGAHLAAAKALALDLAPVRVNCVVPGLVATEMFEGLSPELRDSFFDGHAEKLPVGHVATPEEIAEAYLFAMKCSYLTGQSLLVDGGESLV